MPSKGRRRPLFFGVGWRSLITHPASARPVSAMTVVAPAAAGVGLATAKRKFFQRRDPYVKYFQGKKRGVDGAPTNQPSVASACTVYGSAFSPPFRKNSVRVSRSEKCGSARLARCAHCSVTARIASRRQAAGMTRSMLQKVNVTPACSLKTAQ